MLTTNNTASSGSGDRNDLRGSLEVLIHSDVGMLDGIPFKEAWASIPSNQTAIVSSIAGKESQMYSKFFITTLLFVGAIGTGGASLIIPTAGTALLAAGAAAGSAFLFNELESPKRLTAQALVNAFRSASVEDWERAFVKCPDHCKFAKAIEYGLAMQSDRQSIYVGALEYIRSLGADVKLPTINPSREATIAICGALLQNYHGPRFNQYSKSLAAGELPSIEDCAYLNTHSNVSTKELRMAKVRPSDYDLFKRWVADVAIDTPMLTTTRPAIGSAASMASIIDLPDEDHGTVDEVDELPVQPIALPAAVEPTYTPPTALPVAAPSMAVAKPGDSIGLDLASELIAMPEFCHVLLAGENGTGKTTFAMALLKPIISKFIEILGFELLLIDPKRSRWNGLFQTKAYQSAFSNQPHDLEKSVDRLEKVYFKLDSLSLNRQKTGNRTEVPTLVIIDEVNTWLDALKAFDRNFKEENNSLPPADRLTPPRLYTRAVDSIAGISRMGREDRVWLWLIGQNSNLEALGLSGAQDRANFSIVAVGLGDNQITIDLALSNSTMFTRGQALRNALSKHQGKPYQIAACTRKPANLLIMPSSYKANAQDDFSPEILAKLGAKVATIPVALSPMKESELTESTWIAETRSEVPSYDFAQLCAKAATAFMLGEASAKTDIATAKALLELGEDKKAIEVLVKYA